jgi:hypothetical protein
MRHTHIRDGRVMAIDAPTDGTTALRGSHTATGHLRLLPSVLPAWLAEEADMEAVAFMDDAIAAMSRVLDAEISRDVPSLVVVNECGRVAYRAEKAKAEILRLRGGTNDAA